MRQIPVFHVDAFTTKPFGGNPAGVVLNAEWLTEEEMQQIAREINLSETAFLLPSNHSRADFRIRFFTPAEEINFCGHATLGLSWLLAAEHGWAYKTEKIVFETNSGFVPVEWLKENNQLKGVTMTQVPPQLKGVDVRRDYLAELIGIPVDALDEKYPIKLAYTGNWHLLIPVKSRTDIDAAKPKWSELAKYNRELNVSTTHLFTFDTREKEFDLYTRDFAPAVGIPEDPVTGAANGALAGYLMLEGILSSKQTRRLRIAQGHAVGRPGVLDITIKETGSTPIIQVGGSAVVTIAGILRLPKA